MKVGSILGRVNLLLSGFLFIHPGLRELGPKIYFLKEILKSLVTNLQVIYFNLFESIDR